MVHPRQTGRKYTATTHPHMTRFMFICMQADEAHQRNMGAVAVADAEAGDYEAWLRQHVGEMLADEKHKELERIENLLLHEIAKRS